MEKTIHSVLVTGGARSGKSAYALTLGKTAKKPFFIATGWATDGEMAERIRRHQAERDKRWQLIETRTDLVPAIHEALDRGADFILIDCITLWTSNYFLEGIEKIRPALEELMETVRNCPVKIVLVTNEVGMGVVPENKLAREFRDMEGTVNKKLASAVDRLILTVCGIPMIVK